MEQKIPAISVVIPMYNAEKFIVPCIESLFAQTFRDFEVIVVDHASTDNSYNIVENYVQKLAGVGIELHLLRLKKNFGNPCVPRNRGLNLSRGKYVFFMDADDLLMNNALAEFIAVAETYHADVVVTPNWYEFRKNADQMFPEELIRRSWFYSSANTRPPLEQIEIETEKLDERIADQFNGKFPVVTWVKFSRRDFLLENNVIFPLVSRGEDDLWTIKLICSAKKIVLAPQILYIHRENPDSMTNEAKSLKKTVKFNMSFVIEGMDFFSDLFKEHEFLQQNPQYWCALVNFYFSVGIGFDIAYSGASQYELYESIKQAFFHESDEHAELISYLCCYAVLQQRTLSLAKLQIAELEKKLAER